jgi:SMI1 / KNR4 family (SUKH-1)
MSEIERILKSGKSHRELVAVPSSDDLREISIQLGVSLPPSYVEFCQLGGLGELRFSGRILRPQEIVAAKRDVPQQNLLPFADNGCGDLFCWLLDGSLEPSVVFVDHEEQSEKKAAASFTSWLAANKF